MEKIMEDLLIHTSNIKVNILKPSKSLGSNRPSVCFSLNQFISFFGEYIYIFSKKVLEENFFVDQLDSEGVGLYLTHYLRNIPVAYEYRSQKLGKEFRIYQSIDVPRYCLGVITNFNHLQGILERRMQEKIVREQIDFSK